MKNTYFVTGTDTGVGKTLISAGFLTLAHKQGQKAFGLKPVAAGAELVQGLLRNDDALLLQKHSSVALSYEEINPVVLREPVAPHIAAAREGKRLVLSQLEGRVRGALLHQADLRLIEGAGGWRVPLADGEFLSSLPARLHCPVILVVGMRLGCLNHALLSVEAIRRDGLALAGWVANSLSAELPCLEQNWRTLADLIDAPCMGRVPFLPNASAASVADHLHLPSSFDFPRS